MSAVLAHIDPRDYRPHRLHDPERIWPETNCYADLWIEVLHAQGLAPEAMLGFTVTQDFEGDQLTFFKVPLEDLETLYGIRVTELAIFDTIEAHVSEQIGRGRLCLVEMDSYYMPDTQGVAYRTEHGKTTIGINRLSLSDRAVDYFHNGGFFQLQGEDFDGLFGKMIPEGAPPFLPYTEFVKFAAIPVDHTELQARAEQLLERHIRRMPEENPVAAFAREFPKQAEALAERPFEYFHKYAFNTLRQLGANFELAASHFQWLSPEGGLADATEAALRIATTAKTAQFQLARALTRKKFEPLASALDPAIEGWDQMTGILKNRIG